MRPPVERTELLEISTPISTIVQPPLSGLELPQPAALPPVIPASATAATVAAAVAPSERRGARHRYWSIRDVSRRLWLGRGYELLCELIRTGLLPATRSARSWWIEDAEVQGLLAAFESSAGKVRAFRGLAEWLRQRAFVLPATGETETLLRATKSGFVWRGNAYLPRATWMADTAADQTIYRHRSGLSLPVAAPLAA